VCWSWTSSGSVRAMTAVPASAPLLAPAVAGGVRSPPWSAAPGTLRSGTGRVAAATFAAGGFLGAAAADCGVVADLPANTARKWLPPPLSGAAGAAGTGSGGREGGATACAVMMVLSQKPGQQAPCHMTNAL